MAPRFVLPLPTFRSRIWPWTGKQVSYGYRTQGLGLRGDIDRVAHDRPTYVERVFSLFTISSLGTIWLPAACILDAKERLSWKTDHSLIEVTIRRHLIWMPSYVTTSMESSLPFAGVTFPLQNFPMTWNDFWRPFRRRFGTFHRNLLNRFSSNETA